MSDLPTESLAWLAEHHGVITTAALREHAAPRATVRRLVAAGTLRRTGKGVFVVATAPTTVEQRCVVLSAAHPGGFVTGPTAGALLHLRRMPRTSCVHMAVRHGLHLDRSDDIAWRQTTAIRRSDRTTRGDGITVAAPARLAFDLAADLRALDHLSVVNQLVDDGLVTVDELAAIDRRLGHPARPGSGRFRRTLESLGSHPAQQSHPEVQLADALRRRGVPVEPQVRLVRPASGHPIHLDLAVGAVRWGVELDIHPEHRTYEGQAADASRRRDAHSMGWQVETVTEQDMTNVERLADELAQLYRRRRATLTPHPSAS